MASTPESFVLRQNRLCYARIISATPESFLLHQDRFCCTRIVSAAPESFLLRQNHFCYARIVSATPESFLLHRNRFCYTGIVSATPESFLLHRNRFCYTRTVSATPESFLLQKVETFHTRSISTVVARRNHSWRMRPVLNSLFITPVFPHWRDTGLEDKKQQRVASHNAEYRLVIMCISTLGGRYGTIEDSLYLRSTSSQRKLGTCEPVDRFSSKHTFR
jgi:hypothetical protein